MSYYTVQMHDGELYHHGILGMKWGKRQGPPYPLGASDHSAAEQKAGWRKSLAGKASALGASNVKRALTKQRAKRDYKARNASIQKQYDKTEREIESKYKKGEKMSKEDVQKLKNASREASDAWKQSKADYKDARKEAQRVNNKETWDVLASGHRQRKVDSINKKAERKYNDVEKERNKMMEARQKNRDKLDAKYNKKIAKNESKAAELRAKHEQVMKDYDAMTKSVDNAYKRYWDTYSNRANQKAISALDPSNKKSEAYRQSGKDYSKQLVDELVLYGHSGTILSYALEDKKRK